MSGTITSICEFKIRIQEIIDDLRGWRPCSDSEYLASRIAIGKEDELLDEHVTSDSEIVRFAAAERIQYFYWVKADERQIEFWQNHL